LESDVTGDVAATLKVARGRDAQEFDSTLSPPIYHGVVMSKSRLVPFDAVPFTNEHGMTLNPGDAAVAVTRGRGDVSLNFGKYLGLRKSGRNKDCVVMEVIRYTKKFEHRETGEAYDYELERKELPYPRSSPYPRYGTPEYERWREEIASWTAAQKKRQEPYWYKSYPYTTVTMLKRNKIFPGDIALRDLKL
jgi:hypothetical protein